MAAWRSRALSVGVVLGERAGKAFDDGHGLHTDPDDTAERRDQITRVFEPTVRVVDDAAVLVPRDPVAVDEPFERGAPVDLILVSIRRDSSKTEVVVDDQDASVVISEAHRAFADPAVLRRRLPRLRITLLR